MSVDEYAEWDAAYVLGSLSAAERREFERHMAGCEACSTAVAELAGMPGLLAKVPAADVTDLISAPVEVPVPATLLPRLVRSVARRRRRARGIVVGAVVAAAAAAAAIVLVVPMLFATGPGSGAVKTVALSQVVPSALSASIRLVPEGWGTRIEMNCEYAKPQPGSTPVYPIGTKPSYALFVTDASGRATQIATWTAKPGSTAEPSGTTSLDLGEIDSVDIRTTTDGTVLLQGSP